jgi:hypothetical protein
MEHKVDGKGESEHMLSSVMNLRREIEGLTIE